MCARVAVVTACRLLRLLVEQCGVCYCSPRATQKPWWQPLAVRTIARTRAHVRVSGGGGTTSCPGRFRQPAEPVTLTNQWPRFLLTFLDVAVPTRCRTGRVVHTRGWTTESSSSRQVVGGLTRAPRRGCSLPEFAGPRWRRDPPPQEPHRGLSWRTRGGAPSVMPSRTILALPHRASLLVLRPRYRPSPLVHVAPRKAAAEDHNEVPYWLHTLFAWPAALRTSDTTLALRALPCSVVPPRPARSVGEGKMGGAPTLA